MDSQESQCFTAVYIIFIQYYTQLKCSGKAKQELAVEVNQMASGDEKPAVVVSSCGSCGHSPNDVDMQSTSSALPASEPRGTSKAHVSPCLQPRGNPLEEAEEVPDSLQASDDSLVDPLPAILRHTMVLFLISSFSFFSSSFLSISIWIYNFS